MSIERCDALGANRRNGYYRAMVIQGIMQGHTLDGRFDGVYILGNLLEYNEG